MQRPWRVVVCGTKFGRVYIAALAAAADHLQLAGVVAQGSERSVRCAQTCGVPLYRDVDSLPDSIDAACVIIGAGIAGGQGTALATQLLQRRIAVLQEHPMHHDELAKVMGVALKHATVHQMNTLYPYVDSVQSYIAAASALLCRQPLLYIDATCAAQFKTSTFDILGRILGKLRPWRFEALPQNIADPHVQNPWRLVQGILGGTPITIRLQNQIHATDPDNHAHAMHRITLGTAAGSLMLADTHGPVLWLPRPHIPTVIQRGVEPDECRDPALDLAPATIVYSRSTTWREVISTRWQDAARRAIVELRRRTEGTREPFDSQYYLSLLRMLHDFDRAVGAPEVIRDVAPQPLGADIFATL